MCGGWTLHSHHIYSTSHHQSQSLSHWPLGGQTCSISINRQIWWNNANITLTQLPQNNYPVCLLHTFHVCGSYMQSAYVWFILPLCCGAFISDGHWMVVSKVRPCCSKVIVYYSGNRDYISLGRVIVEGNRLDFFPKTACQGWQRQTQLDSSWDKTSEFKKGWFTRRQAALLLRSHLRLCRQGWFVVCCSGTIPRFSAHSTMSRTRSKCQIVGIEGPLQVFFVWFLYENTQA